MSRIYRKAERRCPGRVGRIVHLLEKEDVIQAPTICGTFIRASTRPKETAAESTKRMGAIVFRDSIKTAGISETLMVL